MSTDLVIRSKLLTQGTTPKTRVGREAKKQMQQMQRVATLAAGAMDVESDIARYAHFKAVTTLQEAHLAAQFAHRAGFAPVTQDVQRYLTGSYLESIARTTEIANHQILTDLTHAVTVQERESLVDRLLQWFSDL